MCGPLVVEFGGERREHDLPGRQGRLLFSYLVLHRHRLAGRDELADALWPDQPPPAVDAGLNSVISKLRKALGGDAIEGRSQLQLRMPDDTWVDVEVAETAAHRAESCLALGNPKGAWGPALAALFIAEREFLPGYDGAWIDTQRALLSRVRLRALETYAAAALGTGGTELPAAVRASRQLVQLDPLRETGYRLLMRSLAGEGNVAEALQVYADLTDVLREQLGVSPSTASQAVHGELLRG
jgi:SARP family transcriptional regulator, regulator of embCAB operon